MSRAWPLMVALMLVVSTAWGQSLNHDAPDDAITEGVLHIKVTEQAKSSVQLTQGDGIAQMGIGSIDQLSAQHGVQRIERMFPTDQRHVERHAKWGLDRWYRAYLETPEVGLTREAVSAFHADASVELAEHALEKEMLATPGETTDRTLDLIRQLAAQDDGEIPNDPLFGDQWHFSNTGQTGGTPGADINLPMAHTVETGSADVIVQVVDSGIEIDHPDISANLWINPCEEEDGEDTCGNGYVDDIYGYNFADNVPSPEIVNPSQQGNSHGLHVSGTIAATNNNGEGVASVAGGDGTPGSGVRIMTGLTFGSNVDGFAEAIVYGADNGAVISNHSWGYTTPGVVEQPVLDAIDYFTEEAGGPDAPMNGGLIITAAGNSNSDADFYPGFYETAMAVAGTDHNDGKYSGSNFGDWVEISAPTGEAFDHPVISTIHTSQGSYGGDIWVGTSMASPHVAGVAALIASNQPGFTSDQVRARLIATGDSNNAPEAIGPRVNAFAALTADDTPPDPITDLTVVSSTMASGASVQLEWTATGEAESEGTATSYDLRYSTDGPIETEDDFAAATPVENLPVPQEAGTTESFRAQGLPFDTEVHFSIKAFDVLGNASDLSNSPSTVTDTAPELALTPNSFTETIEINEVRSVSMNVANTGPADSGLEYSFPGFAAQNLLSQPGVEANNTAPLGLMRDFQKGEDPHAGDGHPVLLGAGGPDDFGYSWIDSNEAGGPAFSWVDASEEGDEVTALSGTWDGNASVDIPFSFPFYEGEYTEAQVSVNGWINFDGFDSAGFGNNEIPSTDAPSNFIAAFWDDLDMRTEGTVHTYHDQANSRFIIQWTGVEKSFDGDGTSLTFQAQLYQNGLVRLQYLEMDATLSASTIGIEAPAGLDGLQVAFNTPYAEDELAIDIESIPDFITDVNPASGSLSGGESDDVSITLNADGVAPDTYENELALTTNDPNAESTLIPFEITVDAGPAAIAVNPGEIDFGSLIENDETTESLFVDNAGGDDLEVTSITSDSDDFTVDIETPFTIGFADPAREVRVTFSPTSVGDISGTLTIESNAEEDPTVTVDVTGEGLPAPVIGVDPESIEATVEVGTTDDRSLAVSNTGGSDLNFEAIVITNGEDVDPEMVAAPFEGRATSTSDGAFTSQRPAGEATPTPFQASDFVYQLDDGTSENALGAGGGDILWLNAFEALEGATTITSIASAFGSSEAADLPEGASVEFLLYDDPTNNGDPSDAVLLERVETTSENPHTDEFQVVDIAPTDIEGTFFIGVVYRDYVDQQFPAPIDESSPSQGASWVVADAQGVNESDLSDNALGPDNIDALGFPGNWLLRADGTSGVVAVSPTSGTVAPGEETELAVTIDATDASPGDYTGDIRLLSNDFANSPLNVPYDVFVDAGPAQIAVSPQVLDYEPQLVGASATLSFEVTNEGGDLLAVDNVVSDSDDFTPVSTTTDSLGFQESATIAVEFTPTTTGLRVGTLTVESNADNRPSIEIAAVGEGLPAPVAGVDPEAFDVTVPIGETRDETLTVENTGEADLDFEIELISDPSLASPAAVAAPYLGERMAASVGSNRFASAAPVGEATPMPFQASDFVYQLDDGSSQNALGAGGGDILWLNAFQVVEGAPIITEIASAFGSSEAADLPGGATVEFLLYDDPSNNGDPSDAVLLQSVETTSENPHTDEFQSVEIEPTEVEGTFFIAVVYRDYADGQFPAPIDESSAPQGASWVVASGDINIDDLTDNDLGPDNIDALGFPGNWLLRANGEGGETDVLPPIPSEAVAFSPDAGTVAPGDSQELTITFDGTELLAGQYAGSIRVLSNDPVNSPLDIPTELLVDAGPPALTLNPESLVFDGVIVGNTSTLTFEVGNEEGNPLVVEEITSNSDEFIVDAEVPFAVRAEDDASIVTVQFAPTAVGTRSGELTIVSNDPDQEMATLAVSGEGIEAPVASLSPEVLQSTQETDQEVNVPLTVMNDGAAGSTLEFSFPAFAAEAALNQPGVQLNNTSSIVSGTRDFDKGDVDPLAGEGHPVLLGAGGADEFGYTWIDSNEEGGPVFSWIDISEDPNSEELPISDDFGPAPSVEVELPFAFEIYGEERETVRVDNNGILFFEGDAGNYFINQEIPNSDDPRGILAPFWTDLDPDSGGTIYALADEENGRFIVQFDEVPPFAFGGTPDAYTFQIILTENGAVRYQYLDMDGSTDIATVGIENLEGTDGLQIAFNADYVENNLAVDIAPPVDFITAVDPVSGSVASGESQEVSVTFDSGGLLRDVYEDELAVSTNDPSRTSPLLTAILSVVGPDGPTVENPIADQQLTLGGTPFEVDLAGVFTDGIGDGLDYELEVRNETIVNAELDESLLTVEALAGGFGDVFVTASNADGSAQIGFQVTVGQLTVNINQDFGNADGEASSYRLVGLPGAVETPLADLINGEAGLNWQAFWDAGASNGGLIRFSDNPELFTFVPGRGFWLTSQDSWTYEAEHEAIEIQDRDGLVTIPLHDGWNIIANPMGIDLDIEDMDALNDGAINQPMWSFDGTFSADSTFASARAGEAYYFLNDSGMDEMVLQPGASDDDEAPAVAATDESSVQPLLSVSARLQERDVASTVQLGVTDGPVTANAFIAPPTDLELISLRIQSDEASLMREQRTLVGEGETFNLELRTQHEGAITLNISEIAALNGHAAALLHREAGRTYDLSAEQTVTVQPTGEVTTLQVAIGTQSYVDGEVEQVLPVEVSMLAYPNPVQDQATVRYTLTEAEEVRLEVYDVLGRRVATLAEGQQDAGVHEIQFNANGLASGVYFGRLRVGDQTLTQKITVVR